MTTATVITEAEILERVVSPDVPNLTSEAARSLLDIKFDEAATKEIRQLLQKNNRRTISINEHVTLQSFLRVG
jgi:hypothetical protein